MTNERTGKWKEKQLKGTEKHVLAWEIGAERKCILERNISRTKPTPSRLSRATLKDDPGHLYPPLNSTCAVNASKRTDGFSGETIKLSWEKPQNILAALNLNISRFRDEKYNKNVPKWRSRIRYPITGVTRGKTKTSLRISTGGVAIRRFVYCYGRHIQWRGTCGRSDLLVVRGTTSPLKMSAAAVDETYTTAFSPKNPCSIDVDREGLHLHAKEYINAIKKSNNLSAVRSVPCKSFNTTRCRHPDCNETETFGHVLGFCRKSELLRNNRHHKVRTGIADVLKRRRWKIHEEIHCVSILDSNRRADIVAIHRTLSKGTVLDPTIRFKRDALHAQHFDEEKRSIYEYCIPYLSEKYNIPTSQWSVSGLLFGAGKNCSGAGYRSLDLWLNVPALCQLSYPGTPADTVSTFPFISTQLAWADETALAENHNYKSHRDCVHSMWVSGVSSAHGSCVDIKGKVETVSGGVPG
ncbi:hypothetical protein ANN_04464 [Periplaneta americana]|uniref:Uncharacterized protein n=1 Tax=Periplaneta americana TaxID=6978 RepID=A0ABQ8T8M4_PERAM|nr:hypothetical protein ANN_04464 [Periplaneta americana]